MADIGTDTSFPNSPIDPAEPGMWQTVEQAAVLLGLSVRTVNRHISAQKLTSRLMDGRREVFVPSPVKPEADGPDQSSASDTVSPKLAEPTTIASVSSTEQPQSSGENIHDPHPKPDSFLDLKTALAMADKMGELKSDRQVELAISAYQSLTRSIETQAQSAKRTAAVAWWIVGILTIGVTIALVWTTTRVTRAESDSAHLKEQAELDAQRLKERVDEADRRADSQQKQLTDMQQKLSEAQQQAARAEGRVAGYEESRQPASRPTTHPTLIDRLTTAFGTGQ